jgi:hypothetical protein
MADTIMGVLMGIFVRNIICVYHECKKPKGERVWIQFLDLGFIVAILIEIVISFCIVFLFTRNGKNVDMNYSFYIGFTGMKIIEQFISGGNSSEPIKFFHLLLLQILILLPLRLDGLILLSFQCCLQALPFLHLLVSLLLL